MESFYWFRDGVFGEEKSYTWEGIKEELSDKFFYDPVEASFGIMDGRMAMYIPRWAVPKEFLVKLMLLGVGV